MKFSDNIAEEKKEETPKPTAGGFSFGNLGGAEKKDEAPKPTAGTSTGGFGALGGFGAPKEQPKEAPKPAGGFSFGGATAGKSGRLDMGIQLLINIPYKKRRRKKHQSQQVVSHLEVQLQNQVRIIGIICYLINVLSRREERRST